MKNHIVFFSGGASSFYVASFVKETYPDDNVLLLFTDTKFEDDDVYRFIYQAADRLELPLLTLADGRNPVELMFDKKMVYNNRIGDCSKILKVKVVSDYLRKGKVPTVEKWRNHEFLKHDNVREEPILYFGIGFEEAHRVGPIEKNWSPYEVQFPLIDHIMDEKAILKRYSLKLPFAYEQGYSHANCGSRCIRAGQAHFKLMRKENTERYYHFLEQEFHMNKYVDMYRTIMEIPLEPVWGYDEEAKQSELERLNNAYRDYFYGRKAKPDLFIHPSASASCDKMTFTTYSFMKKQRKGETKPYLLAELERDIKAGGESIDLFDFSGCGCFSDDTSQSDLNNLFHQL